MSEIAGAGAARAPRTENRPGALARAWSSDLFWRFRRSPVTVVAALVTLIPVITITGLQLGSIIAFAIITESVFNWPGMGRLFIQAVGAVDIPIMAAYLLLTAFLFVTINLIVDLLYVSVDPRIRIAGRAA